MIKLTKTELEEPEQEENHDDGTSPIKQNLRNPQQINMSISDMILQARKEGIERAQKDISSRRPDVDPLAESIRTMPRNS